MAYATTDDVQARNPYRTIGASTKPTTTQVTQWITETEAILNGTFHAAEIYDDYSSGDAAEIVKSWVVDRVSGLVRMAYAAAGGDGTNDDGKDLVEKFDELIEDIKRRPSFYGAMLAGGDAPEASVRVRGYVRNNNDDATIANGDFAPTFTKSAAEGQW